MSAPRVAPSREPLLAFAEARAIGAFESLGHAQAVPAFDALQAELERHDAHGLVGRMADGFRMEAEEVGLLLLLFATAASERAARCAAQACPGGHGIPLWLAQRLIPGLRTDALSTSGVLRRYGFVALEDGAPRIESRIVLREPILDRLCGAAGSEPEVEARISRAPVNPALACDRLARALRAALAARGDDGLSPVACAEGADVATLAACLHALGLVPHVLHGEDIPEDAEARDRLARYWSRDAALDGAVLVAVPESRSANATAQFVDRIAGHVVLAGPRLAATLRRAVRDIPEAHEGAGGADRWQRALGPARAAKLGPGLRRVASQFALQGDEIDDLCGRMGIALDEAADGGEAFRRMWHAAGRAASASPVPGVSVVEPAFAWQDLVLPPAIEAALRRVEMHVRHASTVMDDWGFGARMGGRGRGVAALLAGPSGTGKTMAAEVLASSLDLRMMVIDLSQIISKYVGETSKNVAAAFRMAERCGAVMVWNEGDVIWGSRGTVGNATDRHVNAEIGDLLQRIEAFRGFTIVTTNMRQSIDPAFLRRFRFIVDFPLPSEAERLRLWQRAFPEGAPLAPIDWKALATLPLSGGSIRNVALGSAFLAADAGGPIDARRIAAELAEELRKHDRPMPALNLEVRA